MPNNTITGSSYSTRRFDYAHVILLVERFHPISSLPVNQRVITQIEQPINVVPQNDDFSSCLDYESAARHANGETEEKANDEPSKQSNSVDEKHKEVAQEKLTAALVTALQAVRARFGATSRIEGKSSVSGCYKREFSLKVQNGHIKAVNSPNKTGISKYLLVHDVVKRPVASISKLNEAKNKIAYALQKRTPNVRLDYLDMSEIVTPIEDLYALSASHVVEMNLSHSFFLHFPVQFCNNFSSLRILNLSANLLYHLPAEVATKMLGLEKIDLSECKNLVSLPLTMPNLKSSLKELNLYGCTNLSFPPHEACVKAQIATLEGMSRAGVLAILEYISDPASFIDFSLLGAKKALQNIVQYNHDRLQLAVPSFRTALAQNYIEYELTITWKSQTWTLWRRYSQFVSLVEELQTCVPSSIFAQLPRLPPKSWSLHEEGHEVCEQRRVAMNSLMFALSQQDALGDAEQARLGWKKMRTLKPVSQFLDLQAHIVV